MAQHTPASDPYRRRREAGAASRQQTRQRLLAAADELFRERGYTATTVAGIAERAGVSLQTLYLAWGSKRALLRGATDAAAAASSDPLEPLEWRMRVRTELAELTGPEPSSIAYLETVARLSVDVSERIAPYWRMHREGAATSAEVAADWEAIKIERRGVVEDIARDLPRIGVREGLTHADIEDTLWALTGSEVHELLTVDSHRGREQFAEWLGRTLVAALCDESASDRGPSHS